MDTITSTTSSLVPSKPRDSFCIDSLYVVFPSFTMQSSCKISFNSRDLWVMWVADPWKSGKTWADAMIILIRGDAEQWSETKNTTSHEIYDPWIFRSWTWALLEHPGMPWTYQPRDSRTSLLALLGWMRQSSFSGATRVTHGPTGLSWMVLSTIGGTTGKSCCWIRGFRVHWSPGRSDFLEILGNPLDLQAHFPLKFLDWNQPNDWSSLADTGRLKFESPLQMKHLHQSSLTAMASTTGSN